MNVVEELKRKLENADSDEIRVLEQTEEPVYWFLLLAEYPEFAPDRNWWFALRNCCDLPWNKLLAAQPQFEKYFDWSKVEKQPNHYWDMLLKKQPQFAIHCDFEQLYPNQRRRLAKLFEIKE